ncbi:MAG: HD domain-containing protein [Phycisphaerae bacterium]|nr:HD domain-containing protein [Phycisphaerae bacterium]
MPILLNQNELEPGMALAQNVMNRYSLLLPRGHKLTARDITSIKRVIPNTLISISDPLLDDAVEFDDQSKDREVSQKSRKIISSLAAKVSKQLSSGVSLTGENIANLQETINEVLNYINENPVTTALVEQSEDWDDYLQEQTANVFYLSIMIGNTIRNYIQLERQRMTLATKVYNSLDLTSLAVAAMFHDIGMSKLEYLYHKDSPLTPEELEQVRQHPTTGADMLPDKVDAMVKLVVRSHHENQDGSGYPNGLPADKINIFARIIRVADAYSAGISNKIYKKAKPPAIVLHEMVHGNVKHLYDPVVLKVFSNIVQPFPIGAKLKLKNNQWGVVVKHNKQDPFKPEIVIAFDDFGDPLPAEHLKNIRPLGDTPETQINSFAGQDLSVLNSILPETTGAKEPPCYSELFDFVFP